MKESLRSLLSTEDYFKKPDSLPITDELVDYIFTQSGVVEMAQTTELSHILAARGGAARALKVAKVDRMDVTYQDIKVIQHPLAPATHSILMLRTVQPG